MENTLTKAQKIEAVSKAMTRKTRDDETEFYCFSDEAPEELKDLFLEHYEVRDIDYETFSDACDIVAEAYEEEKEKQKENKDGHFSDLAIEESIYERASDRASVYTATRLGYLNIWNQDEVTEHVRDLNVDIATACAIWYDKQVENQAIIIKNWIEE